MPRGETISAAARYQPSPTGKKTEARWGDGAEQEYVSNRKQVEAAAEDHDPREKEIEHGAIAGPLAPVLVKPRMGTDEKDGLFQTSSVSFGDQGSLQRMRAKRTHARLETEHSRQAKRWEDMVDRGSEHDAKPSRRSCKLPCGRPGLFLLSLRFLRRYGRRHFPDENTICYWNRLVVFAASVLAQRVNTQEEADAHLKSPLPRRADHARRWFGHAPVPSGFQFLSGPDATKVLVNLWATRPPMIPSACSCGRG